MLLQYKYSKYNLIFKRKIKTVAVFNTFTGSFCELNRELFEKLHNRTGLSAADNIEYFDALIEQGILVPQDLDETEQILALERESLYSCGYNSLLTYVIAPTMKCNMNCYYCFEQDRQQCSFLDESQKNAILSYIEGQFKQLNIKKFSIHWFGGEPLLAYDWIVDFSKKLLKICEQYKVEYTAFLITNGLLLTQEKCKVLHEQCNVNGAQITLDGTRDIYAKIKNVKPECFDKVIQNIIECCNMLDIRIRLNGSKENIEDLKKLSDYLFGEKNLANKVKIYLAEIKDYGLCFADSCSLLQKEFCNIKKEFYKYLFDKHHVLVNKKRTNRLFMGTSCGFIKKNNLVIGADGNFYTCEHHVGKQQFIVGNVFQGQFFNQVNRQYTTQHHEKKCLSCKMFPLCLGGCVYEKLQFGNKYMNCKEKKMDLQGLLEETYKNL